MMPEPKVYTVDAARLPAQFPTHKHAPEFWEALGRTVGTFGFLEEILGKAIFALTGTRSITEEEAEAEFAKWISTLERALSDPLGGLIATYGAAVRASERPPISSLDGLLADLRAASAVRNALCHGSWGAPDQLGRSLPLYVSKKGEVFSDYVDVAYLEQVQACVVELTCAVMNTVTRMGFQFPGSRGPGVPILPAR